MPSQKKIPKSLTPIFWDVDNPAQLDIKKYQGFIITRIAEKGRWKDVQWMKKVYSVPAIKRTVKKSRNVNKKVKEYWKVM